MATAQEYINRSLRLIGVLADGETPTTSESNDSLTVLNDMLGLWNVDKMLVYQIQETTHTLVAGTGSYTVGSGADINITRPVKIEQAFVRDSSNIDIQVDIINQEEWNRISYKTTQADFADRLFYDPGFANGTINLYPVPSAANTLHFTHWKPFTSFSTLTTSATFPPGYNQLLVYNLAVLLGAEFAVPVRDDVLKIALDTKEKLETVNNENFSDITQFDTVFRRNYYNSYRDLI